MRTILTICMMVTVLAGAGELKLEKAWETDSVLTTVESVNWDAMRGVLYASCISGYPTDKNGKGFIAKLKPDGTILELNWVTGLNAPKGAAIVGATLYVTDVDVLVAIDIPSGDIIGRYPAEGATFLNDVAAGPDGAVYVSEYADISAVYRFDGKKMAIWFKDERIPRPNGLVAEADGLLVGSGDNGNIVKVAYADKTVTMLDRSRFGVDGLIPYEGGFITSDWSGHVIFLKDRKVDILIDSTAEKVNAADLGYIPGSKLVLVPTFFDNRVVAYKLINE